MSELDEIRRQVEKLEERVRWLETKIRYFEQHTVKELIKLLRARPR